tara:strand:+ start:987 stop:1319 length:333 start_codon:yes stop_codon:yes gene_type:complete
MSDRPAFPKSKGGLWENTNKINDKHPDVKGHIEISNDVLRMLLNQKKAGIGEIKLQIAGWDRTAQNSGNRYIWISAEASVPQEFWEKVSSIAGDSAPPPPPPPPKDDFWE